MKNSIILFVAALFYSCFLLLPHFSQAQNGTLDLSFGNAGKIITDFGSSETAYSVAIQSDGKIVVAGGSFNAGYHDFAIARYNINGSLDNSFGTGGKVTTDIDSSGFSVAVSVLPTGKIMALGQGMSDFILARYHADGTLDSTFGVAGILISDIPTIFGSAYGMAIQNDGKIVLTGLHHNGANYDILLARYSANGILDSTFGNAGIQITPVGMGFDVAYSIALQSDGKIVVAATTSNGADDDFAVIRYNTNGTLDSSFGNNGIQITPIGLSNDYCRSMTIQADGKIIACGYTFNGPTGRDIALVRYNTNGTLDNTFGNGGIVISTTDSIDLGRAVGMLPGGKIIVGGWRNTATAEDFVLACFNTNGTLDVTFGIGGSVTTDISGHDNGLSLAIQNDGNIVLAGAGNNSPNMNDFILARYNYSEDPEGLSSIEDETLQINNYPNPFSAYTTFQTNTILHDATLLVYNTFGQKVKQLNHLAGKEIKLYRDGMLEGFYSFQLIQENKKVAIGNILYCCGLILISLSQFDGTAAQEVLVLESDINDYRFT